MVRLRAIVSLRMIRDFVMIRLAGGGVMWRWYRLMLRKLSLLGDYSIVGGIYLTMLKLDCRVQ